MVQGEVAVGVRPALPIERAGIDLGNGLAGSCTWANGPPPPIVTSSPSVTGKPDESARCFLGVFTVCAMTQAMQRENPRWDSVAIPDSLFVSRSDLVVEHRADHCLSRLSDAVLPIGDGQECCKWLLAPG